MKFWLIIIFLSLTQLATAQYGIDSLLANIEHNNLLLKANTQYWDAKDIEYRTGVTPYDPTVAFDYMYGSPVGAGNQRDFVATQRFDFPTAYLKKRQLSNVQRAQSDWQVKAYRNDILLIAKMTALELVYENKKNAVLSIRINNANRLVEDYQQKLDAGDATILDVNEAKLQQLSIKNELERNNIRIRQLQTKLTELNGGEPIVFNDTAYPEFPAIPDYNILSNQIEENDPVIMVYQYNEQISKQKIALEKAMSLPKPEVGYHSQGILGQSYKGFHVGASIPLWENKNKVKTKKANLIYSQLQEMAYKSERQNEIEQHYTRYVGTKKILLEYERIITTTNSDYLLGKSFKLGQISTVEYFLEVSYYYSLYDKYLQTELEYHQTIAKLYKHRL